MSKWLKLTGVLAVLSAVLLFSTGIVLAGADTHIYGLVYVDSNLNGVWDEGEAGYSGVWQEYWDDDEYVQEYVGATVSFHAGDPDNAIALKSAVATDFTTALGENVQDLCTYQDYLIADGPDEDDTADLNWSASRPCQGTFGLRPAGENGTVWTVSLTVPDGYVATSSPSVMVTAASGGTQMVEFGIAPTGSGGATAVNEAPSAVLLPATGAMTLTLAAVALVVGSGTLFAGSKLRK